MDVKAELVRLKTTAELLRKESDLLEIVELYPMRTHMGYPSERLPELLDALHTKGIKPSVRRDGRAYVICVAGIEYWASEERVKALEGNAKEVLFGSEVEEGQAS